MSVVLVCLPNCPKVSEEAVRKDAELNRYLESRVEGEDGERAQGAESAEPPLTLVLIVPSELVSRCRDDLLNVLSCVPALPRCTFQSQLSSSRSCYLSYFIPHFIPSASQAVYFSPAVTVFITSRRNSPRVGVCSLHTQFPFFSPILELNY